MMQPTTSSREAFTAESVSRAEGIARLFPRVISIISGIVIVILGLIIIA